jgi:hypothetical protein
MQIKTCYHRLKGLAEIQVDAYVFQVTQQTGLQAVSLALVL